MLVVAGILISDGIGLDQSSFLAAVLVVNVFAVLLLLYPGNLAVAFPYAVEIEHGKGLRLFGPMKNVYVPLLDVKDVRSSLLAFGWVVNLRRGHRALTAFTIHGGFGPEGKELASQIEQEIARLSFIPKYKDMHINSDYGHIILFGLGLISHMRKCRHAGFSRRRLEGLV
jgi:hypothetical protein